MNIGIRKIFLIFGIVWVINLNCMEKSTSAQEFKHYSDLPIELQSYILKLFEMEILGNDAEISHKLGQMSQLLKNFMLVNKSFRAQKNELINFFLDNIKKHLGEEYNTLNQEELNTKFTDAVSNEKESDLTQALQAVLAGSDPNLCKNTLIDMPRSALCWAVMIGSAELTNLLLIKGAEINFQNIHGQTVLMCAVIKESSPIVKILLHYKADLSLENDDLKTALALAKKTGNKAIIEMIEKAAE